jgi:hypothetical protein
MSVQKQEIETLGTVYEIRYTELQKKMAVVLQSKQVS